MGPSFVNLLSLSEIYTRKVVARDFQVQIKIAIENSLLSKLSYIITVTFIYTTVQSTLQTTVYTTSTVTRPNNLSLVCLYLSLTLYMHNVTEKKMSK